MKVKLVVATASLFALHGFASAQQLIVPASGTNSASSTSWLAGAQAGYNWQRGSVLYGIEADISGTGLNSATNTTLQSVFIPPPTANTVSSIDWYGTVRGRVGWVTGPVMVYGTGGLAYGKANVNSTLFENITPTIVNLQSSSVKTGWVAGAGIEYLWRPNLILNLGYQYVDLGTTSLTASSPNGRITQSVNASGQFQVVSVGLSWLFPPAAPVAADRRQYAKAPPMAVSEPWSGFYAGGHAGGAWGNRTDASYSDTTIFLSDTRLKRDTALLGRRNDGLGLYRFRYLWSDTVYVGVMAQEVALLRPDAVVRGELDDYLRVDYGRLGLQPMTLSDWNASGGADTL